MTGKDLTDVVSLIKTAKGDTVHLTIAREGEKDYLEFDVERSDVAVPTVAYKMLDDEIGYIAVSEFDTENSIYVQHMTFRYRMPSAMTV